MLLLSFPGCCPRSTVYVPVREARFRTESTRIDRIKLPLTAEARDRLLKFLKAGGDTDRIGMDIVDPGAESRYTPLLDLLSNPVNLALEDLTQRQTYAKWFGKSMVRQVIDAREDSPPAIDPVAVTDGKYWWVFYHHQKRFTELLVIKAIPQQMKR